MMRFRTASQLAMCSEVITASQCGSCHVTCLRKSPADFDTVSQTVLRFHSSFNVCSSTSGRIPPSCLWKDRKLSTYARSDARRHARLNAGPRPPDNIMSKHIPPS
nr:hypothetical protein CFP56_50908 [Quercus suber]